jgi:hypothetical protein
MVKVRLIKLMNELMEIQDTNFISNEFCVKLLEKIRKINYEPAEIPLIKSRKYPNKPERICDYNDLMHCIACIESGLKDLSNFWKLFGNILSDCLIDIE